VRALLESQRLEARAAGGVTGWLVDHGLLPSLAVLTLMGG
jgi:hypothetical protein